MLNNRDIAQYLNFIRLHKKTLTPEDKVSVIGDINSMFWPLEAFELDNNVSHETLELLIFLNTARVDYNAKISFIADDSHKEDAKLQYLSLITDIITGKPETYQRLTACSRAKKFSRITIDIK